MRYSRFMDLIQLTQSASRGIAANNFNKLYTKFQRLDKKASVKTLFQNF